MKKLLILLCLLPHLSAEIKVLALSGSTRNDSYNQQLAEEAAQIAQKMGATVTIVNLKDFPMPFYDADLEESQGMPPSAKKLRQLMIQSNTIIIASPEYNSSVSGILKNALDWASRDENGGPSRDAFKAKKIAIMSASPGNGGGKRGLVHLQAIIEDIGGTVVPTKTVIPQAHEYFANKNRPPNPQLQKEMRELLSS